MSTTLTPQATLGDLVTADPRRARVLENFGLDYCCNGHRTVADASTAADLDPSVVLAALDLPDAPPAAPTGPAENAALAHDIVDTHHAYLWEEMPRLHVLVDKVLRVHGENHPELADVARTYAAIVADMDPHLTLEERKVFPAISRLEKGGSVDRDALRTGIEQLRNEHEALGTLLKQMRSLTRGYEVPEGACGSYQAMLAGLLALERDTFEHIHKENNVLFLQVSKLLEGGST